MGALTLAEREEISRGLAAAETPAAIARRLGRHRATIGREIARNGGSAAYRAEAAETAAWARGCRPKPCRLATHRRLQRVVARQLAALWSPEQIAGWLRTTFPDAPTSANWTMVGICAHESAMKGGARVEVPQL